MKKVKYKYLPYPPLQRIEFHCPDCKVTTVVYSHYPQASTVKVAHCCVQELKWGRRKVQVKNLVRR